MKNSIRTIATIIVALCLFVPQLTIGQCAVGQTANTYCYTTNEVDNVAFEFCPTAGMIAQTTINSGSVGVTLSSNNITVYEGTSGSGTGGSIIFGPFSGDLSGMVFTASATDLCLIYVINSSLISLSCADGFDDPIDACSQSLPSTTVIFAAPDDLCLDAGVQTGLGGGAPAGGVYSGPGVTDDGNGMSYSFDPASATAGVHTLTYTVGGNSASDDIEVVALPTVTFVAFADLCIDAGVQTGLTGGSPANGVYSGAGVTDNGDGTYDFNPALAGLGVHTITYTESGICNATATDDVEVLTACGCPAGESSHFYCGGDGGTETDVIAFQVCPSAGSAVQATIISGTFTVTGNTLSVYEGASGTGTAGSLVLGPATGDLAGTVIIGSGINDCLSFVINSSSGISCQQGVETALNVCGLDITPSVNFTAPDDICVDAGVQTGLAGGLPVGGVYSGAGVTDDGNGMTYSFDPAAAGVNTHTLTYTFGAGSDNDDIEVFAIPVVVYIAPADVCIDAGVQINLGGGTPIGGVYSGPGVTDDGNGLTYSFDPLAAGFGVHSITYTDGICGVTASDNIEVIAACSCPVGAVTYFSCYDNNESNVILFEVCPDPGQFAQADITQGTYDFLDFLTVYQGTTGSGTGGTIAFGPTNGDLTGISIQSTVADECLIFVSNSGADLSCADGFETSLIVCGTSNTTNVSFTALADLSVNAGIQTGVAGGLPSGGVYSGPGVTDDGNGLTYTFNPAIAGVGIHTLTYTVATGSASDDVEVLNLLPPSFSKSFNPTSIGPGAVTTLTFTIDNSGSGTPVTDINFTDNLPAGMTIASAPNIIQNCFAGTITAVPGGTSITFADGELTGTGICTISVNVTTSTAGTSTNTTGDLTSSAGNSGTASANLTLQTQCPIFTKSFSPSTVNIGETSTLTFTIDNSAGGTALINPTFTDNLPAGMTIASPANVATSCADVTVTAVPGSSTIVVTSGFTTAVGAGGTCTITVDVVANSSGALENITENFSIRNTIFQIFNCGFAAATLNVLTPPEIFIQKSFVTNPVSPGGTTDLEFTLTNLNRDFPATNVSFTDDLTTVLAGLTATGTPLNDICGTGSQLSGTTVLTFTGGTIPADGSCTFTVPLQVPAGAASGTYTNVTGTVTADHNGVGSTGNMATANLTVAAVPSFTKTFLNDPIPAGGTTTVEFTITNNSTTDALTDLTFTDNIAQFISGATISALPPAGSCGAGSLFFTNLVMGDLVFQMNGGNIAAGASCTFTMDVTIPNGVPAGTYTNTTSFLNGNIGGQPVSATPASDDLQILGVPQLSKTFLNDPVNAGDIVNLEFTITHDASATGDATNISFTDDLNAVIPGLAAVGLPLNDICGTGSSISGTTNLTFTSGTLSPGGSCTFSVPVLVPAGTAPGSYTNTTSALSATVGGQSASGNTATDDLDIGGITFTKEFLEDNVIPGETTTLRFTIDNASAFDGTNIFFSDNLSGLIPGMAAQVPLPTAPCGASSITTGTTNFIFFNGEVAAGTSCSFDVNVLVPASATSGTYTNVTSNLSITLDGAARALPPAIDDLTVNNNLIELSKTFTDDPVLPGSTVTVEYTLTNLDPDNAASNIAFTDDFDGLLTGLAATGLPMNNICGTGSQVSGTGLVSFTGGNLAAGASCTFSVTLQVPASAPYGAVFTSPTSGVSGEINSLPVIGDPAMDDLVIQSLQFTKSMSGPVEPGQTTTITFTITNADPVNSISDIAFTDDLDAFISGATATNLPLNGICGGSSQASGTSVISFGRGELSPGASCSFNVEVMIPCGTAASTYTNTTSTITGLGITAGIATADLTVNSAVTLNFTAPPDFCLDAGVQLGMGQTTTPTGGTFSGPGVTDDGNGTSFTFTPADAGVGMHILTYSFVDGNGCTNTATDDIEIFAVPTVAFTAPADLCIDAGNQTGLGGGTPPQGTTTGDMGVYSGPGVTDDGNGMTYSFNPATAGVGTHALTYTYTNENSCSASASDMVQVFALPIVMFAAPADLCIDAGNQTGLGGGTPTGGVYSGPGVIDDGNGMTYSFNPATATVGVHTITYTVGVAGCSDSAMDDIEVFALPIVAFTAPADLCIDAGVQTGLSGGSPGGGVYFGNGVTDNGDGTFDFNPANAGVGQHIIIYSFTDTNGCDASDADVIDVFASPIVAFTAPADLCIDAGVQTGLGGGTPPQGTVTGDLGVYSGPGVTDDGNGMTYSFNPATASDGTHTLTYTYTDENGCTASASDDVEVFALPVVTFTAPADLCVDAANQTGLGGGLPTGGVYSGPGVTDDGNGMTYSFNPATATVGTHTITYTVGVSGCSGSNMDDIEVFALPMVTFTAPANLCINAGVQSGLSGGSPGGGVYFGNGVTDNGDGTFDFNPANAGVGQHIIIYSFTDTNGCDASDADVIDVFALPTVMFTAPADLCVNAGVQAGLGGGTPPQGTVTGDLGVYSGPGVTDDGNGMTYSFDPAAAGVGTHTLSYTYTDENGCSASASDMIEIFALPTVMFIAPADLCVDAVVQNGLGGGTPTGGVYSGPGVTDDANGMTYSFDPSLTGAGIGTHTITYTFTDANGCSGSASDDVEVFSLPPNPDVTLPQTVCIDAGVVTLGPLCVPCSGAVYSGIGVTNNGNGNDFEFNPAVAGVGVHPITATLTNSNGCTREVMVNVTVTALPTVMFTSPADLCVDAGVQAGLGGGTPPQGTVTGDLGVYSGSGVTDDGNGMTYSFDPAMAGVGTHNLTYNYTDENGCTASASDMIEVFALPTVMFTAPAPDVCIEDPIETGLGGGMPTGGVYSGDGVVDDANGMTFSFDPTVAAPGGGNVSVTYTFTDANGCSASASDDIFVDPICCELIVDCSNITDEMLTCRADLPPVDFDLPIIIDSCGNVIRSALTIIPGNSGCPGDVLEITRTYFLQDEDMNMAECMQTFTIVSNTGPTITCPADMTVECVADIMLDPTDAVTTSDCSDPNVVITGPVISGDPDCPMTTYTYTYTATDFCNRMASCEQIFTIENDAPTITCPADMTVECAADIMLDPADATVVTSCTLGSNTVITGPVVVGDPDCPNTTLTYTYTVTDDCNRTASCEQVFTIENDPPTITCPMDMTVECAADIMLDPADATVTTSCTLGSNTVITGPVVVGDPDCPGTRLTYTYTVTDDCNRTASCEQVFTIANDPPTISCPGDMTVECAADIMVDPSDATVTTSCTLGFNVEITGPKILLGGPNCPGSEYKYFYTVIDDCGRQALCERSFFIENDAPTITCPADQIVSCKEKIVINPDAVSFTTSCDLASDISGIGPVLISGDDGCDGAVYEVTYIIRDACERSAQCVQRWTLDNNAPVIVLCAPDRNVECVSDIEPEYELLKIETDCGDAVDISASAPIPQGAADNCPGSVYTIVYTVTDNCGRTAECTQIWKIDNAPPRVIPPDPITIACLEDLNLNMADAEYEASCGIPIVETEIIGPIYNEDKPLCQGSVVNYLYTVWDACGRMTCEPQIIIIDLALAAGPEFDDIEIGCDPLPPVESSFIACGQEFDLEIVQTPSTKPDGTIQYTRVYTGLDECGEVIEITQIITQDCPDDPQPSVTCMLNEEGWANLSMDASGLPFSTVKLTEENPFVLGFEDRKIVITSLLCVQQYLLPFGEPRAVHPEFEGLTLSLEDDCKITILDPDPSGTMNNDLMSKMMAFGLNLRVAPGLGSIGLHEICEDLTDGILGEFTKEGDVRDLYNVGEAALMGALETDYEELSKLIGEVMDFFVDCPDLPCTIIFDPAPNLFEQPETSLEAEEMVLYPNPAHDYIKVKVGYEKLEGTVLRIYSTVGMLKMEIPMNEFGELQINISELPVGLYHTLLMVGDNVISYEKFIRQE